MSAMTLLGWTLEQWAKAVDYYQLCERRSLEESAYDLFIGGCLYPAPEREALKEAMRIQKYWADRRNDAPCQVKLEIAA